MSDTYGDRELTAFIDRVQRKTRRSRNGPPLAREAWREPPALTLQKTYDHETQRLLAQIHLNERTSQ